ncbi:uncharacterized protein BDZ99DRAFT_458500, partial [Mytilinidion resinicola]
TQIKLKQADGRRLWQSWWPHCNHSGWSVTEEGIPVSDPEVMEADFLQNESHR